MSDLLKIYDKFKEITEKRELILEGDAVLAAVSGGRDSTALLLLLSRLVSEKTNVTLALFHYNHCLRGAESDGDARFAEGLARKLGIECFSERGDVAGYAAKNRLSIETAARDMRYGALRKCAEKIKKDTGRNVKIAVAHTAEDRAETVFLNIARGTSVDGLEGIKYISGDIIRPILDFTKEDVETVCRELGTGYRTDSTNFERIGKRNMVRLDVFPMINEKMGCDITERLLSLSKLAAEDGDYLSGAADEAFKECATLSGNGDVVLRPESIEKLHPALRSRVVRKAISLASDEKGFKPYKDCVSLGSDTVARTLNFIKGGRGNLELGKNVYCTGSAGKYRITAGVKDRGTEEPIVIDGRLLTGGGTARGSGTLKIVIDTLTGDDIGKAVKEAADSGEKQAVFDLDRLLGLITDGESLVVRAPAEGDRIRPFGAGGGKPLGKFLTDRKIQAAERYNIKVLALGKNALHVFGVRRSDAAPVTGSTERCVRMKLIEE